MSNAIIEITQRLRSCIGFNIHWKIGYLAKTHSLFVGNYKELCRHLERHSTQESLLIYWGPANKSKSESEMDELSRLFHNYMASAKTMVDHSRVTCRELLRGKALSKYEEKAKQNFQEDTFSQFIQNLRNFVQHQSHPPILVVADLKNNRIGYQMDARSMAAWSGWNSKAQIYIKSLNGKVYIQDIVSTYTDKVVNFNIELIEYLKEENKPELDALFRINDELAEFCKKSGIPLTEEQWREYDRKK